MNNNVTPLAAPKVRQLKYILFSGDRADEAFARRHDSAYQLWKRNWQKTFHELKSEWTLRADDFTRQSIVSALFDGEQAVGLLLHTYIDLNLEAVRDHSYLATYPAAIIDKLRAEGSGRVFSMEYLTLDPAWGRRVIGVPLAEIILGLGAKVAIASGLRSMIVVTRNDKRVNEILYGFGARCLSAGLQKHNVAVDLVALDEGKIHFDRDETLSRWIEYFWTQRVDATGFLDKLSSIRARSA